MTSYKLQQFKKLANAESALHAALHRGLLMLREEQKLNQDLKQLRAR